MNTTLLLLVQYDAQTVIPLQEVVADFFPHLSVDRFSRKVARGEIKLPVMRIEGGKKSAQGVHVIDLSKYIDDCRRAAIEELNRRADHP